MTVDPHSPGEVERAIEAVLMVADQPVAPRQLAEIIGCSPEDVEVAAAGLIQAYADDSRGFVLQRVAGGLRFQSHPDLAPIVERFVLDGQASRLSAAALETMAIVAYKQPISRNQVSAIRGVNADGVIRTLEARGYVEEIARDPGPGRASLYGTTPSFLERLGLNSIDELPPLGQFVPDADVVEALETTLMVGSEADDLSPLAPASETDADPGEATDPGDSGEATDPDDSGDPGEATDPDEASDSGAAEDDWAEDLAPINSSTGSAGSFNGSAGPAESE